MDNLSFIPFPQYHGEIQHSVIEAKRETYLLSTFVRAMPKVVSYLRLPATCAQPITSYQPARSGVDLDGMIDGVDAADHLLSVFAAWADELHIPVGDLNLWRRSYRTSHGRNFGSIRGVANGDTEPAYLLAGRILSVMASPTWLQPIGLYEDIAMEFRAQALAFPFLEDILDRIEEESWLPEDAACEYVNRGRDALGRWRREGRVSARKWECEDGKHRWWYRIDTLDTCSASMIQAQSDTQVLAA